MAHEIHISVVSHGHGAHIEQLLADLAALPSPDSLQLTLTQNIPEPLQYELEKLPFPVKLLKNSAVESFAKNHNVAFQQAPDAASARYFVVLNPDVRVQGKVIHALTETLQQKQSQSIAVIGPTVVDDQGQTQSNGRIFPDFSYLLKKLLGNEPANPVELVDDIAVVDWVAGMCMVLQVETFDELDGFDEQYRLYYEDVDLCLRLRQRNLRCAIAPDIRIQHQGQWQSRRNLLHFWWHCRSVMRFLAKRRQMTSMLSPAATHKSG